MLLSYLLKRSFSKMVWILKKKGKEFQYTLGRWRKYVFTASSVPSVFFYSLRTGIYTLKQQEKLSVWWCAKKCRFFSFFCAKCINFTRQQLGRAENFKIQTLIPTAHLSCIGAVEYINLSCSLTKFNFQFILKVYHGTFGQ